MSTVLQTTEERTSTAPSSERRPAKPRQADSGDVAALSQIDAKLALVVRLELPSEVDTVLREVRAQLEDVRCALASTIDDEPAANGDAGAFRRFAREVDRQLRFVLIGTHMLEEEHGDDTPGLGEIRFAAGELASVALELDGLASMREAG